MNDNLVNKSGDLVNDLVNDCISRQAAIDAFLTELTKRERTSLLHIWSTVEVKYFIANILEQLPPAQPGCEDAVSRADVDILIEEAQTAWLRGDILLMYPTLKKGLQKVPSVTPKQPGWISCKTALPEHDGEYLVTINALTIDQAVYAEIDIARYKGGKWRRGFPVVAWQPLPTPYREGEKP